MSTKKITNAAAPVAGESRNGSIGYPTRGAALEMWTTFSKQRGEIDISALAEKNKWSLPLAQFHVREWRVYSGLATKTPRAAKKAAPAKKAPAKKTAAKKAAAKKAA